MGFRHSADLPKSPLPNAALLGWQLVSDADDMNFTSYEANVPYGSTVCLQSPGDGMTHIYYCISGEGTCLFADDGTKYSLQRKHLVALSSGLSCNLTISSPNGMRLFVVYCKDKSDSNIRVMRSFQDILGTDRDIDFGGGYSRRLLLKSDGFLVGFCITSINPGAAIKMQYRNHLEACYYYTGGKATYSFDDEKVAVETKIDDANGTMMIMNKHDKHTLTVNATENAECISLFYPVIDGKEIHHFSEDGYSSY
ncbi:L-ectoine synthase-like [Amphiura filiformis]|uniref:L-ectoine synthase-like n=1 Tax=Amphiura filiformis TaxID=82378 RepID=UPI003B21D298